MMDINADLFQLSMHFLINKNSGSGIKNQNISKQVLAEELHKQLENLFGVLILLICNE